MLLSFETIAADKSSKARAGFLRTDHGEIETPVFMPVGTQGTVKAVNQDYLKNHINAQIVLSNTYHLYLRPGTEVLEKAGGLHKLMNWDRPILTDSGGFQIFSLADLRSLKHDGVEFKSHLDGSKHFFTPKKVLEIQRSIGSDIMMVLDECTPFPCEYEYAQKSVKLTSDWAAQAKEIFDSSSAKYGFDQNLFGIIQGSTYKDLRERSAKEITELNFNGYAIGGLAVGEPTETMYDIVDFTTDFMPADKPRYLMGVGRPENLLEAIERGIDMFDCVMPTRNGRNGMIFTGEGIINIRNKKWENDFSPIDINSNAETSRKHSKAFLRHLFYAGEMLGPQIASIHNLSFYLQLVKEARKQIMEGNFAGWKKVMIKKVKTKL